jgi:hypothetical protein
MSCSECSGTQTGKPIAEFFGISASVPQISFMTNDLLPDGTQEPRVLMLSQRKLKEVITACIGYEFEDIICKIDAVDLVTPEKSYKFSNRVFHQVRRISGSTKLAEALKPEPNRFDVEREYELLFVACQYAKEIPAISSLKGWRKRCKKAVCYILEIWERDIHDCEPLLQLLKDFDHVFIGHYHGTQEISNIIDRPCTYLPFGVDAIKFCPYPQSPQRSIDVSYIGRRSAVTHKALLTLAEQNQIFYYYDTFKKLDVRNASEHRLLYANLLKRSSFFIANQAKVNEPGHTAGQAEFGSRFFEGAAAGTIMIGAYHVTDAFNQYFGWQDAVIQMPFDMPDIAEFLDELNSQPDRLARVRRDNVVHSLLCHDWLYRWQKILTTVGLKPTLPMLSREARLKELAERAMGKSVAHHPLPENYSTTALHSSSAANS